MPPTSIVAAPQSPEGEAASYSRAAPWTIAGARIRIRGSAWGPVAFVWSLWAWFAFSLFGFVADNGSPIPFFDEWEMIPALVGEQPITLKWLWSQHNEHRMWLPRLIYVAVERAARFDFRAAMYFDVALLVLGAAALMLCVQRIRGRVSYFDAFFPVLLLTRGQGENLLWSFQVQFVVATMMAIVALIVVMSSPRATPTIALCLSVCAFCSPLLGGNGLAFTPAFALAAAITAWMSGKTSHRDRLFSYGSYLLSAGSLALMAFYFVDYTRPAKHPTSHSVSATWTATLQFLGMGFGAGTSEHWQETTYFVLLMSAVLLVVLARNVVNPRERARALRVLLFLGGLASLALGIAWARNALGPGSMFASRYATLAMPFWCGAYCAFETTRSRRWANVAQGALFLCVVTFFIKNIEHGATDAAVLTSLRGPVLSQLKAGDTISDIVAHNPSLYYGGGAILAERFRMLRNHRVRLFRNLKD